MIKITHPMLEVWNISEVTLFAIADDNLYSDEYELIDLAKCLANAGINIPAYNTPPMYVLSNKSKYYGAAMIVRQDVLDNICDLLGDNVALIPSSVHEWICIKDDIFEDGYDTTMVEVIKEINASCLTPDEVLGEHAYRYARNAERIMKA